MHPNDCLRVSRLRNSRARGRTEQSPTTHHAQPTTKHSTPATYHSPTTVPTTVSVRYHINITSTLPPSPPSPLLTAATTSTSTNTIIIIVVVVIIITITIINIVIPNCIPSSKTCGTAYKCPRSKHVPLFLSGPSASCRPRISSIVRSDLILFRSASLLRRSSSFSRFWFKASNRLRSSWAFFRCAFFSSMTFRRALSSSLAFLFRALSHLASSLFKANNFRE